MFGLFALGLRADRWHNSGGSKAARNLPPEAPIIRRRYGSLAQQTGKKYRYHEYCMLDYDKQTGAYMENRTTTLFHLMLPLVRTWLKWSAMTESCSQSNSLRQLVTRACHFTSLRRTKHHLAHQRRPRSDELLLLIATPAMTIADDMQKCDLLMLATAAITC